MRDDGDRDRGGEHEPDRKEADRPDVRAQVAERGEEGRAVEERRQEDDENEVGRQLEVRDAGREAGCQPAEHEQDRIRHLHERREREQRRDRSEEREEDERIVVVDPHEPSVVERCLSAVDPGRCER